MNEEKAQVDASPNTLAGDLQEALDKDPDFRAAFEEMQQRQFQSAVQESRKKHVAFVRNYMGQNYVPKFADALGSETYFVSFFRTKKTANVAIPPVEMSGQKIEHVKPGRMYACSGYEARMLERVLASKKIEVLNLTPRKDQYLTEFNWIVNNWGRMFPHPNNQKRTNAFGNYREETAAAAATRGEVS